MLTVGVFGKVEPFPAGRESLRTGGIAFLLADLLPILLGGGMFIVSSGRSNEAVRYML